MDVEGLEEMLFTFPSSQDSLGDEGDDTSEDEMLEDFLLVDTDPWQTYVNTALTPPATDPDPDPDKVNTKEGRIAKPSQPDKADVASYPRKDREWVISRIESILEQILDALLDESEELAIELNTRVDNSRRKRRVDGEASNLPAIKKRKITFPGSNAQEAWRFTVLTSILELIHGCLVDNVVVTKRDIYYRHPDLFVKQSVVDRYVDDLARTFGVPRAMLNVTAAAKGLVAGNLTIRRDDGTCVNVLNEKEGILVPRIHSTDVLEMSMIQWILVIEKEATFRSFLSSPQWPILGSESILVTAKGYPDIASRKFLWQLANHSPHIPMYALVDFDPDGIGIMSTYKYGSYRLAHENETSNGTPTLNLPKLRWLGVKSHQIYQAPVTESDTDEGSRTMLDAQGLLRLTPRDRKKATSTLELVFCAESGPERGWRRELQTMLMLNVKAETQVLEELPGGVISWLWRELAAKQG